MKYITKNTFNSSIPERFSTSQFTVNLGVTSTKSALLLNYIFNIISKRGLLYNADANVMIDDFNNVGVYFRKYYYADGYIRAAKTINEIHKTILNKIANELKKIWVTMKMNSTSNKLNIIYRNKYCAGNAYGFLLNFGDLSPNYYSEDCEYLDLKDIPVTKINDKEIVEISFEEYRTLYEFLKGRDTNKIKKRYGIDAWNSMIGKQIENQFVISAIDTIKNEIKKVKDNYNMQFKNACQEKEDIIYNAQKTFKEKTKQYEKEMNDKINELKNQFNEIIKISEFN